MLCLAISGSLRSQSTNTVLLETAQRLAPSPLQIELYEELEALPAFNPDLASQPPAVERWRTLVARSSLIVLSIPEYAHGIPGAFKNALDWIVGTGELSEKPVLLMNASSRGVYAQAALKEVLVAMNAQVLTAAELTVDIPKTNATPADLAAHPQFAPAIKQSLQQALRLLSQPAAIFAYGTLMSGESRHPLLEHAGIRRLEPGWVSGRLIHLGDYPGLEPDSGIGKVMGEWISLETLDHSLLARLDAEEGDEFQRRQIFVHLPDGSERSAWVYVYTGAAAGRRLIPSGDWKVRG